MAQTNLCIRMDEDLKKQFSELCESIGMNMTTAVCIFAKRAVSEHRIPFELVSNDPFYSESNIKHLEKIAREIENGTAKLVEHDLIEVDD